MTWRQFLVEIPLFPHRLVMQFLFNREMAVLNWKLFHTMYQLSIEKNNCNKYLAHHSKKKKKSNLFQKEIISNSTRVIFLFLFFLLFLPNFIIVRVWFSGHPKIQSLRYFLVKICVHLYIALLLMMQFNSLCTIHPLCPNNTPQLVYINYSQL